MLHLLAQTSVSAERGAAQAVGSARDVSESLANLFSRVDALAHPDELMANLQQVPVVVAVVFVAAGMVCLLQGFKLYKAVVISVALLTGLAAGYKLGQQVQAEVVVAVCLGIMLAVVAWPLMKYAVAIAGGLAGAFIGANLWTVASLELPKHGVEIGVQMPWLGALVGLMTLGFLSFIVFDLAVVLFTSMSGAVLVVMGVIALMLQLEPWGTAISESLSTRPVVLPLLVVVPAVIGLVIQQQRGALRRGGEKAPAAAPAKA